MGRTAPSIATPHPDTGLSAGLDHIGQELGMDKVMAELALAFARDVEIAEAEPVGEKWPAAWSLAFVVVSSVALWVFIAALVAVIL